MTTIFTYFELQVRLKHHFRGSPVSWISVGIILVLDLEQDSQTPMKVCVLAQDPILYVRPNILRSTTLTLFHWHTITNNLKMYEIFTMSHKYKLAVNTRLSYFEYNKQILQEMCFITCQIRLYTRCKARKTITICKVL